MLTCRGLLNTHSDAMFMLPSPYGLGGEGVKEPSVYYEQVENLKVGYLLMMAGRAGGWCVGILSVMGWLYAIFWGFWCVVCLFVFWR